MSERHATWGTTVGRGRAVVCSACGSGIELGARLVKKPTDIRIDEVSHDCEEFHYRTPFKFGAKEMGRTTILNVRCVVHTANGRPAHGFGSMTLRARVPFVEDITVVSTRGGLHLRVKC